jgi:Domain of unknown function (DUF2024)
MNVSVWDTYVKKKDGSIMHFDVIVPIDVKDANKIYAFGQLYLIEKNETASLLSAKECQFCHIESASEEMIESIMQKGYFILEMEGCI